jgi:hypothetical protein
MVSGPAVGAQKSYHPDAVRAAPIWRVEQLARDSAGTLATPQGQQQQQQQQQQQGRVDSAGSAAAGGGGGGGGPGRASAGLSLNPSSPPSLSGLPAAGGALGGGAAGGLGGLSAWKKLSGGVHAASSFASLAKSARQHSLEARAYAPQATVVLSPWLHATPVAPEEADGADYVSRYQVSWSV